MPLVRRMPKRGFTNAQFRRLYHLVNVSTLEARFEEGADITAQVLADAGVIRDTSLPLKVLGQGELKKKLNVTAAKFSASARAKIEAAGGAITEIAATKWTRARAASAPKKDSGD